jgi:hypothetical protein
VKHLQKFEAFLIPKPVRKFMPFWSDEDVALTLLKELKNMKATPEVLSKMDIKSPDRNNGGFYNFNLGEYNFDVKYGFVLSPGGGYNSGDLRMNGEHISTSSEVCKKIQKEIVRLKNADANELREYDKKDFLRTYKK